MIVYTTIICINQNTGRRDVAPYKFTHWYPVGDGDLDVPCMIIILRPVYNYFSASRVVILQISRCFYIGRADPAPTYIFS